MEKMILRWSRKEKDWQVHYPNRNGKIIGGVFCRMITEFEERSRKNWKGEPTDFKDFYTYLKEGGFDPNSLRITIEKLPNSIPTDERSVATTVPSTSTADTPNQSRQEPNY